MRFNSFLLIVFSLITIFLNLGCAMATSAEEYYSIGMAYFDLGKYEDAEKWLIRARQANKTYAASQYNLGRIAYERQRFDEAVSIFERILRRDPNNILALRAAAYTNIKIGNIEAAQKHYAKVLELIPESADDGYNHALVLFAMERYIDAEDQLNKYPFALRDNKDMQLLLARSQGRQKKAEAIENFSKWLKDNNDYKARYEYAVVLEHFEYYARALEEYRKSLTDAPDNITDPKKFEIRFAIAKTLLIAERESNSGVTELQGAVTDGFKDISAIEELINSGKLSRANTTAVRTIADNLRRAEAEAAAKAEAEAAAKAEADAAAAQEQTAQTNQENTEQTSETNSQ